MEQQEVAASISLKTLHPFIDKECVIRVVGRLEQTTLNYHKMHKKTLPSNHLLTHLVFSAEHI